MALPKTERGYAPRKCVAAMLSLVALALPISLGCSNDADLVREIQSRRQAKRQSLSKEDHLGDTFALLVQYIELEPAKANRQIAYHLNRWSETRPAGDAVAPEIVKSIREIVPEKALVARVEDPTFRPSDASHLRDSFLFNAIYNRVDDPRQDESLLADWFKSIESELDDEQLENLKTASRIFDWTVRNVSLEPDAYPVPPQLPQPKFPFGMTLSGPGYRQTDFQTVMRGTGDGQQRASVFTQLCRQANIPAAVIATIDPTTGDADPFAVGVIIGEEIYLFEPRLGIFVPGPGQVGIATLSQARRDALVLRRLGISGLDQFTYPVKKEQVQQCVALLNLIPECISPRMSRLQNGLTGDRRMNVYVDADALAKQFDDVTGIGAVRMWKAPLLSEVFKSVCDQFSERDPIFGFWYFNRWAMLDADIELAKSLEHGRWLHLVGQFSDSDEDNVTGARSLYLSQRAPEFEIEDLRIDVDLQKAYGIRRDLGVDSATYDKQIAQIQGMMRMGKRTATYWLSLLQADDGRLETAESWLRKRVLNEEQLSYWAPSARYNMARLAEQLGETDRATELYKREGEPQEHGNRIRARLVAKQAAAKN